MKPEAARNKDVARTLERGDHRGTLTYFILGFPKNTLVPPFGTFLECLISFLLVALNGDLGDN